MNIIDWSCSQVYGDNLTEFSYVSHFLHYTFIEYVVLYVDYDISPTLMSPLMSDVVQMLVSC